MFIGVNMRFFRKWKRGYLSLAAALLLLVSAVLIPQKEVRADDPAQVVVTVYPAYDWIRNILGEEVTDVEVTWLFDNGVDPHSYQPSVEDIMRIASCDLFVYVGGVSDQWVQEALAGSVNPDMQVICLLDVLGEQAKEEELTEGMEAEAEDADAGADEAPEWDEHVWLSLKNAGLFCDTLSEALQSLDPDHAADFQERTDAYKASLEELDHAYEETVANAPGDTLLFGDRFPFRYLTDDYGLNYYAAFAGCSAETEASFETIVFLAEKMDELQLPCVLVIDGSDERLAETIIQSTKQHDQAILTLDSLQSVKAGDVQEGVSYLSVMEENRQVLEKALDY